MKSPVKMSLLSIILAASVGACSKSNPNESGLNDISGQAPRLPNGLGQGFESDTRALKSNCVTGDLVYAGSPSAEVTYAQDVTYDQVVDTVSGGLNLGVKINIFDIKGAADFASQESSDAFSSTITLTSSAAVKSAVLQNVRLNDLGKAMIQPENKAKIRSACGDEFVSQINYSAKLFVNTKFHFTSAQDRQEFKGNAHLSLLAIGEIGGQISILSDNIKKNSSVSITARQIGGNPEELSKILDDSVISCNLAEFETKCLPMLKALVKYAREDFPKSLTDDPVPTSSKGWAEVLYETDKYSDVVFINGTDVVSLVPDNNSSILTQEINLARDEVADLYQVQMTNYRRAADLLRDFPLDETQTRNVTSVLDATAQNRKALVIAGESCLKNPKSCLEQRDAYKKSALAFDVRNLSTKVCLIPSDVADSNWTFSRTNGEMIGNITLAKDGTIKNSGHSNESNWKVEGCILRFYSDKNVITTTFDVMANTQHLVGNYFVKTLPGHKLDRIN